MRTIIPLFKALSDKTRLQMLALLFDAGELCVCDFVAVLRVTQSKASRHLRHLVDAGLLDDRHEGAWVYFRIADAPGPVEADLLDFLRHMLDDKIPRILRERLDEWVRGGGRSEVSCQSRLHRGSEESGSAR